VVRSNGAAAVAAPVARDVREEGLRCSNMSSNSCVSAVGAEYSQAAFGPSTTLGIYIRVVRSRRLHAVTF